MKKTKLHHHFVLQRDVNNWRTLPTYSHSDGLSVSQCQVRPKLVDTFSVVQRQRRRRRIIIRKTKTVGQQRKKKKNQINLLNSSGTLLHNCPNVKYYKRWKEFHSCFCPFVLYPTVLSRSSFFFTFVPGRNTQTHHKTDGRKCQAFQIFFCLPNLFVSRGKISGQGVNIKGQRNLGYYNLNQIGRRPWIDGNHKNSCCRRR
jgi:hypothetical protein